VTPLLTSQVFEQLVNARRRGAKHIECTLDLQRSMTTVEIGPEAWIWEDRPFSYPQKCKDRTIYHWAEGEFRPVARYSGSLIKLVPTDWGPPTFEIDGIKMLPTLHTSPYADAERKVRLIEPRGKVVLDTCGGLGYFAAACLQQGAGQIRSYEKNADVLWLREINPWSPDCGAALTLTQADITDAITELSAGSVEAVLHDPPRFGIAGNLYSQEFYNHLARVLRRKGKLFHYTGSPNKLTTGRDVPGEVARRLRYANFDVERIGDGLVAVKK
jgi:uncharacterized protein